MYFIKGTHLPHDFFDAAIHKFGNLKGHEVEALDLGNIEWKLQFKLI